MLLLNAIHTPAQKKGTHHKKKFPCVNISNCKRFSKVSGCAGGAIDSSLKKEIRELSSKSSWVSYIHFALDVSISSQLWLNSKTCKRKLLLFSKKKKIV